MGVDDVDAGSGDDTVIVRDLCEIASGEVLDGGSGNDTLRIPHTQQQLASLGVTILGFETVVVDRTDACGAECTLPCSDTDPDFEGLSDPTAWTVPQRGPRFRRTTAAEQSSHGWFPGSYLVEDTMFVSGAASGAAKLVLYLPDNDSQISEFDLSRSTQSADVTKVSRVIEPTKLVTAVTKPTVTVFNQSKFNPQSPGPVDGAWVEMVSTDDGEIFAYGSYGAYRVEISGSNPGWSLAAIAVPSGPPIDEGSVVVVQYLALGGYGQQQSSECNLNASASACGWKCANTGVPCDSPPAPAPPHHCADGLDNDSDGGADYTGDDECGHNSQYSCGSSTHTHRWESGESFVLMGTGPYCNAAPENWFSRSLTAGWNAAALVNYTAAWEPNAPERRLRFIAGGCWVFPSEDEAWNCTLNGNCSTYASTYPYKDAGTTAANYYGSAWDDVDHAAQWGLDEPVHMVSVLYQGEKLNGDRVDLTCASGGDNFATLCCGAEKSSGADCSLDGASVSVEEGPCGSSALFATVAHEFGHNLGLGHDNNTVGLNPLATNIGGPSYSSFMNSASGIGAALCGNNQTQLENSLGAAQCPRLPGFSYNGSSGCLNCAQATCP